ncbi:MAG TPA: hypothetical protein V6C96_02085 [Vampirovibrionales bacterium]
MATFQRLRSTEEEFVHLLEDRLNSVDALPWKNVIQPVFVSADDAYTMIQDEVTGVLPAMGKRDSFKRIGLPEDKFKEHQAITIGAIVEFSEEDVNEKSGNLNIPGTTITLSRSKGETEANMISRATSLVNARLANTILKASGEWLQGQISFEDVNGNSFLYNTSVTDGGAVGVTWDTPATATPIQDMEAIDIALQNLAGNYGRTLDNGNTIMSRKISRYLAQVEQIQRLPGGDVLSRIPSFSQLEVLPTINEYFGNIIRQNMKYPTESGGTITYNNALEEDHIYVTSGTQSQPVGKLAIAPGGLDNRFSEGRGFSIRVNRVPSNDLNIKPKFQVAIQATLIMVEYSPIYKKQVI